MHLTDPILIVGAGMGGLSAALALLRVGLPVMLFEQAPELGEIGAGITMYPNMSRVLDHLGVGDEVERLAVMPFSSGTRHWKTGEFLRFVEQGHVPAIGDTQYGFLHRADLHTMLLDACLAIDPDCVTLNAFFDGYRETPEGVIAHFASGLEAAGTAIVGCDGIKSQVRAVLFGPDAARFTGRIMWRGLVPAELVPPAALQPESAAWPGPNRLIIRYPIRARTIINYTASTKREGWTVEDWRALSPVQDLLDEFAGWHDDALALFAATPPDLCFKWAIHDRPTIPSWTVGRVTLLGDAAHPMEPYLGQGAAMAIEDGVVLARCIVAAESLPEAFSRYEAARLPRCHWFQREAHINGERLLADPGTRFADGTFAATQAEIRDAQKYNAMTVPI